MRCEFRPAIVIPCFNHGSTLRGVLTALAPLACPVIIVDDGSERATREEIDALVQVFDFLSVIHLPINSGKGAAVLAGLRFAAEKGFTHALQIDADGQHDVDDAKKMLALAEQHPDALISGKPVYDESIPKKRLIGRYITHFWVWVETWGFAIKDSLCGFRVYPLERTLAAADAAPIGLRMNFDPEIMVRFYWRGGDVLFMPTHVTYPKGGLSHFRAFADNVAISRMHAKLFFQSFIEMPRRALRRSRSHWAEQTERSALVGTLGFDCLYYLYRLGGRTLFNAVLFPVLAVFWLTGSMQRRATQKFVAAVEAARAAEGLPPSGVTAFALYRAFGNAILDRILSWRGEMQLGRDVRFADALSEELLKPTRSGARGTLLLASHLGVADVTRAIAQLSREQIVNVLMFERHAEQFKRMLAKRAPDSQLHVIPIDNMSPATAAALEEAVSRGEWVAIAADRIPVGDSAARNATPVSFLGETAYLPIGPYVLAHLLRAPVITLFALREADGIVIHAERFATGLDRPKHRDRRAHYQCEAQRYATRLAYWAMRSPQNWFNFYDFWQKP